MMSEAHAEIVSKAAASKTFGTHVRPVIDMDMSVGPALKDDLQLGLENCLDITRPALNGSARSTEKSSFPRWRSAGGRHGKLLSVSQD
jgi:hypothetical protein